MFLANAISSQYLRNVKTPRFTGTDNGYNIVNKMSIIQQDHIQFVRQSNNLVREYFHVLQLY